jgi:stearoyl-CoA desaturase (delta-9 desaturase)
VDLLTPARTWATAAVVDSHATVSSEPADHMPRAQRLAMLVTVVGPFLGLIAAVALLWHRGPGGSRGIGWPEILVMAATYALAGFGVTVGYHRLLTHRAFETARPVRLLLAVLGSAAGQGMVIRWCATHRRHHQRADRPGDPHSPHVHGGGGGVRGLLSGLWHAHVGWTFQADAPDLARSVPDLLADRALVRVDQLYLLWVALGLLLPAAALGLYAGSWRGFASGLLWGGLVRTFLMHHVTWSVNSVCHVWGSRPFASGDRSTNNFPVAILSLGEGWHNNHHAFPTSARHGLRWWQFDASFVLIRLLEVVRVARNVRVPSGPAMEAKRAGDGAVG